MGKPYKRLKYDPPEKYGHDGLIGHGEAVSMITGLLVGDEERWDMRRRVDNHIRYAIKQGSLEISSERHLKFGQLAAWANERYGKESPNISRMHHGENIEISGVAAAAKIGRAVALVSFEDYQQELEESRQEIARLRVALAESEARRERERPDIEIGIKVREGCRKGGNSLKTMRPSR